MEKLLERLIMVNGIISLLQEVEMFLEHLKMVQKFLSLRLQKLLQEAQEMEH